MSEVIAIIAAVRDEVLPLVERWSSLPAEDGVEAWRLVQGDSIFYALCGGMGSVAATRAFGRMLVLCTPRLVVSVGWAGALRGDAIAGQVYLPMQVVDVRTGEMLDFSNSKVNKTLLVTSARVAGRAEKLRLVASYPNAALVDMEAATIARLSMANKMDFRSIKAVSDTLEEELPDLNPYIDAMGQFHIARFALWAAVRPAQWSTLLRFGRNAKLAAAKLCEAIERELRISPQ